MVHVSCIGAYSKLCLCTQQREAPPPHASKVYFVKSVTIEMWDSNDFYPLAAFT